MTSRVGWSVGITALCMTMAACGGGTQSGADAASDLASPGGSDGGAPRDGGADASSANSADLAAPPPPAGGLTGLAFFTVASVSGKTLIQGLVGGAPTGCSTTIVGPCEFRPCGQALGQSEGTVTVTAGGQMVNVPFAGGAYSLADAPFPLTAGQSISVAGTGDMAPAFSASVVTPGAVTFSTLPTSAIDRAQPLSVSWTGTSSIGVVTVSLSTSPPSEAILRCSFDPGSGSATIPSAALQMLPAAQASLQVGVDNLSYVQAGGYTIRVRVANSFNASRVTLQ